MSIPRNSSNLTRMQSTASSQDPFRTDNLDPIPPSLYEDDPQRRYSVSESFRVDATGRPIFFPWRTALLTLFLFSLGLTFILVGALHIWEKDQGGGIAMVVLGSVAFVPGAYAAYNLWHAVRGTPGFHLSDIAFHDDFRW